MGKYVTTKIVESEWQTPNGDTRRAKKVYRHAVQKSTPAPAQFPKGLPSAPALRKRSKQTGLVLAIGDMQAGKKDGGDVGVKNAVTLGKQFAELVAERQPDAVAVALLGDHIEGSTSQGGALSARTTKGVTYQIKEVRSFVRGLWLALRPLVADLTMVAVPGNHGDAARNGAGSPTWAYGDNHDTDAVDAVREGITALDPKEPTKWVLPGSDPSRADDMVAYWECAGVKMLAAHGHQWKPGKALEWWQGQAFHDTRAHAASVLLSGHLHHHRTEMSGPRLAVQAPTTDGGSVWFQNKTGEPPFSGATVLDLAGGRVQGLRLLEP